MPGEELFTFYGSDYFQDVEGGCPCKSCDPETHKLEVEARQNEQLKMRGQMEIDKSVIEDKRKAQKKRRRDRQQNKGMEA